MSRIDPNEPEPAPIRNDERPVWELVIEDMRARDQFGRKHYGTPLQSHNGRDALMDAYQEALDQVVYLRQAIEERTCGRLAILRSDGVRQEIKIACAGKFNHSGDCSWAVWGRISEESNVLR